jgi:inhibitor of KinA sporulation pathway (predicted exonuclease)
MGRNTLNYINVVDVESTCWEGDPPAGQQSEIIQIGIARLQLDGLVVCSAESYLVIPRNSEVSSFCTELTGITPQMIKDRGLEFVQVCALLRQDWQSAQHMWASYGDYDRVMFDRHCEAEGTRQYYPFGRRHLNVKTLTALALGLSSEVGMDVALQMLGMKLDGRHHDAMDDAKNIAHILRRVLSAARNTLAISLALGKERDGEEG